MKWSHPLHLILLWVVLSPIHHLAAQESTPEPQFAPILDETYSSKDGRISISYPKNWTQTVYPDPTTEPGMNIRLSNSADSLKYFGAINRRFPSGDVVIVVRIYERY